MDFIDLVQQEPRLDWVVARVKAINSAPPTVDLVVGALVADEDTTVEIKSAAVLRSYTPRVGDVVHAVFHPNIGALVLGTSRTTETPQPLLVRLDHATTEITSALNTLLSQWSISVDLGSWEADLTKVTIPSDGVYHIQARVSWPPVSSVGVRRVIVRVNGVDVAAETQQGTDLFTTTLSAASVEYLLAGSEITVLCYQNNPDDLSINSATLSVVQIT